MPRYIDADALKELIDGGYDLDFDETPETKRELLRMIDYQETADVVEVVRCKDCKWLSHFDDEEVALWCGVWSNATNEDSFCSWGERREDGD